MVFPPALLRLFSAHLETIRGLYTIAEAGTWDAISFVCRGWKRAKFPKFRKGSLGIACLGQRQKARPPTFSLRF